MVVDGHEQFVTFPELQRGDSIGTDPLSRDQVCGGGGM